MNEPVFFRPRDAWVGDVIPWREGNEFVLFYLHEVRSAPKPGTPWHMVTTRDGVTFRDRGEAFAAGDAQDEDFNAYTGSIVLDDAGNHHMFYTGQNPGMLAESLRPLQFVMHATSSDGMATWTRHPEQAFGATAGYETADWRDPFVFRDEDAGLWRMLIAARHTSGPDRRRGVIAQCVSRDLQHWSPTEPFWDPRRYVMHECPEVFQMGDWWYLVYSEFSEAFTTRYRMSRSATGPWTVPQYDSLDGRAYYAAKSAERDGRRLFFGWIATREGDTDAGAWQWAGTLSVLEAVQQSDGTLGFRVLPELVAGFSERVPLAMDLGSRERTVAPDGYRAFVTEEPLPDECVLHAIIDIEPGTVECGLLLRSSADGDTGYVLRLEPRRGRVVFDSWPRPRTGGEQWQISGDVPFDIALERPCDLAPGLHTVTVVLADDICVVTVDDSVTLSTRVYDHASGHTGFFVGEGGATLVDIAVSVRPSDDEGGTSERTDVHQGSVPRRPTEAPLSQSAPTGS
jgi:beta-fructofuranosidase